MLCETNGRAHELERYRAGLRLLARLDLDPRLQGKLDLSGVVQQTLLEAHQGLGEFRGQGDGALLAWLKQILARNLLDEVRKLKRVKFDATHDQSLDELSSRAEAWLAAEQSTPSERACRNEELLHLAEALEQLPQDQQTAVMRHHLQGVPLADVAGEMGRSKGAVASLLFRGLRNLRDLLVRLEPI
jgi:RNA polymerase sigma-70 factor (ECF subfamily)